MCKSVNVNRFDYQLLKSWVTFGSVYMITMLLG